MSHQAIWDIVKFQYHHNGNFTIQSLSDKELLKFKLCVDECIKIMISVKSRKNFTINPFIISWCNQSNQIWFHELYYELWKRSPDLNFLINVVQRYFVPILIIWSIVQITILSLLLFCFTELRKVNVLWLFLLCYCVTSEGELVLVILLFNNFGNKFNVDNIFCRSKQFISSTLTSLPHWILAETLFNQSLISLKCTNLPPVGVLGAKIIIICSVVVIVVLNSHSLWLYSIDPFEKTCNIHSYSQAHVFVVGYPVYLEIIKNLLPEIAIIVCVGILMYCHQKRLLLEKDQIRTPMWLGINYLFFNLPSSIYWFMSYSTKSDDSLKPFNELKINTFVMAITDILVDQSNLFILPIIFATSFKFRNVTQNYLENLFKRVREFLKPSQPDSVRSDTRRKNKNEIGLPLVKIIEICE